MGKGVKWAVWAVLFVGYAYMAAVVMPGLMSDIQAVSETATCARPLDLFLTGFSLNDVERSFTCMGPSGLEVYRAGEVRDDVLYPIAYGLFLTFTIWALSGATVRGRFRILLVMLPVLTVGFDLGENAHIVQLIDQFPDLQENTVHRGAWFNRIKWAFAFLSILTVLVLASMHAWRLIRGSSAR